MSINHFHPLKYSIHTRLRLFHFKHLIPSLSKDMRILDVGCGLGYLTEKIGEGFFCTGLDLDFNSLKNNRLRGLKNMLKADASNIPFPDKTFDVIICSEVLEHLPPEIDKRVLKEMARILRPGGIILLSVPSLEGIRASSKLRNLGHNDKHSGEYHYRLGYFWNDITATISNISYLKISRRRYSMFLFSEIFMDLLKLLYLKKNPFHEQSDITGMKDSLLFLVYRLLFPILYFGFIMEDILLASIFKGHILILALNRIY